MSVEHLAPVRLGDLATAEGISPPTLTKIVAALEEAGLVQRSTDEADRRSSLLQLTDQGRATLHAIRTERTAFLRRQLDRLERGDRRASPPPSPCSPRSPKPTTALNARLPPRPGRRASMAHAGRCGCRPAYLPGMPIDAAKVDALLARARREVDDGLLPSCQVALALEGELVAFETFGDATPDTRYHVFSCTKAFVAAAVWALIGDGLIDVQQPVITYIPEFGTNGKDVITVEQVMLHTAGFPHAPLGPPDWDTREGRVAAFARWRLNWEPGTSYEYHATSAHWVLAEIIDRVTGGDYRDVVEERVTGPAGLPRVLGLPESAKPRTASRPA